MKGFLYMTAYGVKNFAERNGLRWLAVLMYRTLYRIRGKRA
jgi:hypothetical protein